MALTDMYEVVHRMTQHDKNLVSVYHVERANTGESAGSISDAFQNDILPVLRLLQTDDVINDELYIFNLGTPTDFGTFTLTGAAGLRSGSESPTFIAATVRFPSRDRSIRSGFKRFPGLEETDYTAGVIIAATNTLIDNCAAAIIADWTASSDSHQVCNYVIIKRVCETFDAGGKCVEYRLPATLGELEFYTPNSYLTATNISSQVSRKIR